MEVDTCNDETDHCTCLLYGIVEEESAVPQSDAIIASVDFDELGTICTADSQLLSPSHHSYVSLDGHGQIQEDNTLGHRDSHGGVVVQDVVEEEVGVNVRADTDGGSCYCVNGSDSGQIADSSEAINTHVEYVQNVVMSCCYVCGRKFTRLQTLKGHMKRQHGTICELSRVVEEILPIATVYRQCDIGTSKQPAHLHVIQKHDLPVDRPPRQCKTNPRRLMLNRRRMAAQKAAYPPIVCLICSSEIGLLKNYDAHIKRYHRNDSKFAEALSDVRRIQFERAKCTDGTLLNCETCGESYDKNRLIAHIKWKHSDSVNLKQLITAARHLIRNSRQQYTANTRRMLVPCPHCGRQLRQISLANHIKFSCSAAEQPGYAAGSSTRSHVQCTICGQSMPRPKLFRHRRLVHQIGTYKQIETFMCEYCPREFTEAHQLRTHVKKHTGIVLVCSSLLLMVHVWHHFIA